MTLEDHAGDVVRKARLMAGIPAADSAEAGRVTPQALDDFEQQGRAPAGIDWTGLARRLDLDAGKLRALAEGWSPTPVTLSVWNGLRVITTTGSGMSVNCFLVWDAATRGAALFDTGFDATPIFAVIDEHGLRLEHLFITHTHGDHVAALEPVRHRFPQARLHTNATAAPAQHRNQPDEEIVVGSLRVRNRATPGHADDGVTYVVEGFPNGAPKVAIVGDAIFAGSIGGAPGKGALARQKIREHILSLPDATLICPGHGPVTTVGEQKAANPFFA